MRQPNELPPEIANGPFAIEHANAIGVWPGRMRARDLRRPYRGIRSIEGELPPPNPDQDWINQELARARQRITDFVPRLAPGMFFSHASAAILWDLPIPIRMIVDPRIHVSVYLPAQCPRIAGVIGHRFGRELSLEMIESIELTDPVATMCTLARSLTLPDLVAIGDHILAPAAGEAGARLEGLSPAVLTERASAWRGRPGAVAVARAMPLVRAGVRSPRETLLRLVLVAAGFPEPLINLRIYDSRGRFLGEADLVYPRHRILFEYEGDHHRTDREQFRKDIPRRERFENAGYRVFRVISDDLGVGRSDFIRRVRTLMNSRE